MHLYKKLFAYLREKKENSGLLLRDHLKPKSVYGRLWIDARYPDGQTERVYESDNLILADASILLAWLCKDNTSPVHGLKYLAIGSGDWEDLQNPPAPTSDLRHLQTEFWRKAFKSTSFRLPDGSESPGGIPTNVVDYVTEFGDAEANGAWCEMGLCGGNAPSTTAASIHIEDAGGDASAADVDLFFNVHRFPVVNKPQGATFTITWRITY